MMSGEQGESVTLQERPSASDPSSSEAITDDASSSQEAAPSAAAAAPEESSPIASGVGDSDDEPSDEAPGDDDTVASSRSGKGSIRDLEEEGEVAADYLEELLDIVDLDGDIDIDVENGRPSLAIVAEGGNDRSLRRLVGSNGEVLEALQELTRLAVQASTGERSRLMLDVAGHRAQRRKVLTEKATQACEQVKTSGKSLSMEAMTAFERKIVHDVVADAGLNSESEGVDPNRHVVILPASD
jgi:spoIIIJ-associated protein